MKQIGAKLALQIALVLIIVMSVFGGHNLAANRRQFTEVLDAKQANTIQQLALIVSELLFFVNLDPIEHLVHAYLADPDLLAITVRDERATLVSAAKDPATGEIIHPERIPAYPDAELRTVSLTYEGETVGSIDIVFSRAFITDQSRTAVMNLALALLLSVVVEVIVVVSLTRYSVTRPLIRLVQAAQRIADGDVDFHLAPARSQDEIGRLTQAFSAMIDALHQMASVAREIALGNLRHIMEPKSADDVVGQAFFTMSAYLNEMAAIATAIADGDLRHEAHPKTDDDVLGIAFQRMKHLREAIQEIRQSISHLRGSSDHLDQISRTMAVIAGETSQKTAIISDNSQHISENVEAVATASEQLSANVREIAGSAVEIADVAGTAVQKAQSANATIAELETRSQKIGNIIKIITAVTQQTNLLALNATIEAARAGDFGKGFAVVAHEIKDLSRETASSAEHIIQNLEMIRTISQEAVAANTEVAAIISRIQELSAAIASGIEEHSVTTADMARRMSEAAHGSKQISDAITDVAAAIHNTADGVAEVQHAATGLAALADQLQTLVKRFKI